MLLLASFVSSTRGLSVKFSPDFTKYYVEHDGVRRFSAEGGFAAFVNGKLESTSNGGWKTDATATSSGSDVTFGAYTQITLNATVGGSVPIVLSARNYASEVDVHFTYNFPTGASGTSLVKLANKTRDEVIVSWPAFTTADKSMQSRLSWASSFVHSGRDADTKGAGPQGGPIVWFDGDDALRATTIVGSPLNNFKASSAGPKTAWDGKTPCEWCPGTPGTITSIPAGHTQTFMLHAGAGGVTATIGEWGALLRKAHSTYDGKPTTKLVDVSSRARPFSFFFFFFFFSHVFSLTHSPPPGTGDADEDRLPDRQRGVLRLLQRGAGRGPQLQPLPHHGRRQPQEERRADGLRFVSRCRRVGQWRACAGGRRLRRRRAVVHQDMGPRHAERRQSVPAYSKGTPEST